MLFTINSRKLDEKVTFSRPGTSYVYVDLNGKAGSLGLQICEKGFLFRGNTLSYDGDDQAEFEKLCRTWFRQYLAK